MAFLEQRQWNRCEVSLCYTDTGKNSVDGYDIVKIQPYLMVKPFDETAGYAHETIYYIPLVMSTQVLDAKTQRPLQWVLRPVPDGTIPSELGKGSIPDTVGLHLFPDPMPID